MKISTNVYRRVKRDGRNPSTGAKSIEEIKESSDSIKNEIKPISSNEYVSNNL